MNKMSKEYNRFCKVIGRDDIQATQFETMLLYEEKATGHTRGKCLKQFISWYQATIRHPTPVNAYEVYQTHKPALWCKAHALESVAEKLTEQEQIEEAKRRRF